MAKNYMDAIKEINSSAQCTMHNNDLSTIEWFNGTAPISIEDIEAKASEIEIRDAYILPRVKAYPSITEQLDMQYHDKKDGTTTWEDAIQAVKDANPKA
jgi:hypothetical protein|tara:strand:+ start:239 stop:535 length:297 start_codon:yes stop_codon:yes gene_type:complete